MHTEFCFPKQNTTSQNFPEGTFFQVDGYCQKKKISPRCYWRYKICYSDRITVTFLVSYQWKNAIMDVV